MDFINIMLCLSVGVMVGLLSTPFIIRLVTHRENLNNKLYAAEIDAAIPDVRWAINYKYQTKGGISKGELIHLSKEWHRRYPKVAFVIEHHKSIYKVTIKNRSGSFMIIGHYDIPSQYIIENWIYGV